MRPVHRGLGPCWRGVLASALLAILPVVNAGPASAQPPPAAVPSLSVVTRRGDNHARGSLRAAVDRFNASGSAQGVIILVPGTYDLTSCGPDEDTDATGDLDVLASGALTIVGVGHVTITQTCAGQRVLDDHGGGHLTLVHVTITGGNVSGLDPAVPVAGGGVRTTGAVTLWAAALQGNRVTAPKGADATPTSVARQGGAARGGAIAAGGQVTLVRSTLSLNAAVAGAGGSDAGQTDDGVGGAAAGGAITTPGAVDVTGSTLAGNQALGGAGSLPQPPPGVPAIGAAGGPARGGAIDAQAVSVQGSTLQANAAVGGNAVWTTFSMAQQPVGFPGGTGDGGAVAATGPVSLSTSTFRANRAIEGSGATAAGSHGGGISTTSSADVSYSTFDANVANRNEFSEGGSNGGAISTGAALDVANSTFTNNAGENGGAVHSGGALTADSDTFTSNRATKGGAVEADGTATVVGTSFTSNHVTVAVGSAGGALYASGAVSVARSSFSDNHLDHGNADFPPFCRTFLINLCYFGDVGAHGGAAASAQAITATDSTFSGNSVQGGFLSDEGFVLSGTATGGALAAPTIDVSDSTIVGSAATQEGFDFSAGQALTGPGHGEALDASTVGLTHVTLTDSSGASPSPPGGPFTMLPGTAINTRNLTIGGTVLHGLSPDGTSECGPGVVTNSRGYDYLDDASCSLTGPHDTITSADPALGPLADNGGPTLTRLPAPASPLIDTIPATLAALCTGTDQRGVARPQGPGCDIGAVEASVTP
jgi:predicted outer membrane repeat protein